MAWELPSLKLPGLEAGADLSADQFKFVKADSTADQVVLAGNGEAALGVLQNDPDAVGKAAEITALGVSKIFSGAAVTFGAVIASDATGRAAAATIGEFGQGIALEAASGAGELISALIIPGHGQVN